VVVAGAAGSHENHGLGIHDKFIKDLAIYSTKEIKNEQWVLWNLQSRFIQCLIYELYLGESGCVKKMVWDGIREIQPHFGMS
jgi:hypothetical protein